MHYKYVWRGLEEMFEFAHLHYPLLRQWKLSRQCDSLDEPFFCD